MKKFWQKMKGSGKKIIIRGLIVGGLGLAGINLPEPAQEAAVLFGVALIESF